MSFGTFVPVLLTNRGYLWGRRPDTMQRLLVLRGNRLDRHRRNLRPHHGRTDRRRIVGIVLLAQHEGLHMLGRQQPHPMPHRLQLSSPVMGSAACLHAHLARRQFSKERQHLRTLQSLADDPLARNDPQRGFESPVLPNPRQRE
jgi:hypothetical protein